MKCLKVLNDVVTLFTALVLAFMTIMVMLQVIFRYVLSLPFPESQELAVYAMVYVVTFGSSIAVYRKTHVAVTLILEKLPAALGLVMRIVAYVAMAVFFGLLIKYGWDIAMRAMIQRSPSTGIPVGYVMMSIPVSSVISLLYVIDQAVADIRGFKNRAPAARAEEGR